MKHATLTIIIALNVVALWFLYGHYAKTTDQSVKSLYQSIDSLRETTVPRPYYQQQDDGTYRTPDGNHATPLGNGVWSQTLLHTINTNEQ